MIVSVKLEWFPTVLLSSIQHIASFMKSETDLHGTFRTQIRDANWTKKRRFKSCPIGVVHFEYFRADAFGIYQLVSCVMCQFQKLVYRLLIMRHNSLDFPNNSFSFMIEHLTSGNVDSTHFQLISDFRDYKTILYYRVLHRCIGFKEFTGYDTVCSIFIIHVNYMIFLWNIECTTNYENKTSECTVHTWVLQLSIIIRHMIWSMFPAKLIYLSFIKTNE